MHDFTAELSKYMYFLGNLFVFWSIIIIISPHENNNYNASIQIPGESGLVYKAQLDATDGIEIVAVKTVKGMVVAIMCLYIEIIAAGNISCIHLFT